MNLVRKYIHKKEVQKIYKPFRNDVYLLIRIAVFILVSTCVFGEPGKRTYTRDDVEMEKELSEEEDDTQGRSNNTPLVQQAEVVPSILPDDEESEKSQISNMPVGDVYKVEHCTNTTDSKSLSNNYRSNMEEFRANVREIREKKQREAEYIRVTAEDIDEAKRRIIDELGIDVQSVQ